MQSRELRTVLPLLVGQRLLRREAVQELDAAYRFLRVLENRLQQWNDEQTHQLPDDDAARARLAYSMGFPDWAALERELDQHRERVARHFAQTMFGPGSETDRSRLQARSFDLESSPEERLRVLRSAGLASDAAALAEQLEQLRVGAYYRRLDETGRRRLRELLPRLLPLLVASAAPDAVSVANPEDPRADRRPDDVSRAAQRELRQRCGAWWSCVRRASSLPTRSPRSRCCWTS